MKQLLRKPFLLALILSLPLWIVFNNYIVAICVALLVAFLLSMIESLLAIQRHRRQVQHQALSSNTEPAPSDLTPSEPPPSDPHP